MSKKSVTFKRFKRMSTSTLLELVSKTTFSHDEAVIFAKVLEGKCPTPQKQVIKIIPLLKAA